MSTQNRNIFIACGVLLLAACVCVSLLTSTGLAIGLLGREQPTVQPTSTIAPAVTPLPATPTSETVSPTATAPAVNPDQGQSIPADVAREMDLIQAQTIQIRGLKPTGPVTRALLSPDQLKAKVTTDFLKDYTPEDAKKDVLELSLLGLMAPNFDFLTFYKALLSEQIAGYYDDKTKEMYVVQGESFTGIERMTYSHEYTHVLQDQNYDLRNGLGYQNELCKTDSEKCAGIQALIEGDATLEEQTWFTTNATSQDRQDVQDFYKSYKSPIYDSAPDFLKQDFLFPYRQGLEFVQSLYDQGGWQAVDAAYKNVPLSTEQILHPELYPDDKPVKVAAPNLSSALGSGWKKVQENTLGEWYTYLMLAYGDDPKTRLSQNTASEAAAGWGGDTYVIYQDEATGKAILVLVMVWDQNNDATQFRDAFRRYGISRWGSPSTSQATQIIWDSGNQYVSFERKDLQTIWILAPDAATGKALESAVWPRP